MKNFWKELPRPFTALAPLDGVTDVVFRQIVTELGKPDVLFTEFTMTDGLVSAGRDKVAERLLLTDEQKPVVAQIWGTIPEHFYEVAKDLEKRGFAGIDINMGCPVREVTNRGACAGLIRTPELASDIIRATKEGAGDLPVSVKTRMGFEKENIDEWISFLLRQHLAVLTVHLRTVKELSQVPAHWEEMKRVIKLRDQISPDTLIIGNGDITSLNEIAEKYQQYSCDGFMIGRGIFANPWLFNKDFNLQTVTIQERTNLFLHHIELFEKQWSGPAELAGSSPATVARQGRKGTENSIKKKLGWNGSKNFALLKKFAKTYINNFPDAANFREKLMETKSLEELKQTLKNYPVFATLR
jgi:tRNA-dihydrouridine synthase